MIRNDIAREYLSYKQRTKGKAITGFFFIQVLRNLSSGEIVRVFFSLIMIGLKKGGASIDWQCVFNRTSIHNITCSSNLLK